MVTLHFSVIEHAYAFVFAILTVKIGLHIQTLYNESQPSLPPDFHSTIWSKMKGRSVMQESSQLFLMLKCNTLHTVGINGTLC